MATATDAAAKQAADDFYQVLGEYLPQARIEIIRRALDLGQRAHEGQMRKSGEPFIVHPIAVASLLADMRMDHETVAAAILHDVIEDTPVTKEEVEEEFGSAIAELVDGVTKLDHVRFKSREEQAARSFIKLMLAMTQDIRVILVKLADRLHNMRTIDAMSPEARRRIGRETLDIYAPIAHRLGMNAVKAELQNLSFAAVHPLRHKTLTKHLAQTRQSHRDAVISIRKALQARLDEANIPCRIDSRIKSPYSIYRKMKQRGFDYERVMDVYGMRVVTKSVSHCYQALGAIHSLYPPRPGRIKDYIALPKTNGYQSLHTTLIGPFKSPIEVQIRTEEMDTMAERGIAAHWMYKSDGEEAARSRAQDWLVKLMEMREHAGDSMDFLEHVKLDLFPNEVYVFTPAGDILQLPRRATCVDFAYAIHTELGNHTVAARIDGQLSPLATPLESGQTVEVVSAENARPNANWLDFVTTSKARTAIRHHLRNLRLEEAVELGHRMLDKALDAIGSSLETLPDQRLEEYLKEAELEGLEELLNDIALGNRMPIGVARRLAHREDDGTFEDDFDRLTIRGNEGGVVSYGGCCHPIPGDAIVGYLSAGRGIVVHRKICKNLKDMRKIPERIIPLSWDDRTEGVFRVALKLNVQNRPGVLSKVTAVIAQDGSNIEHVDYGERDGEMAALELTVTVPNRQALARLMRRVRRSSVVLKVQRSVA